MKYKNIRLIEPKFDSNLTDLIIELDYLRKKKVLGTTHPQVFFQLKHVFHILESIGSARIEGNHTTIAEYIETKIAEEETNNEEIVEIKNIEACMSFIDENINDFPINRIFLSEIHKKVVESLTREGSTTPGLYRQKNLIIAKASHCPPDFTQVNNYMEELIDFINENHPPKYDLLKIALVHHRFSWIHPFDNGNGRTVRLLTYAMLIKQGFPINSGTRILNPTAIFCSNREKYYNALSQADNGADAGLLAWCEYMLSGLKDEIGKIDLLLEGSYVREHILKPAINFALERKVITPTESEILSLIAEVDVIQASDLREITILKNKHSASISRTLSTLKDKKMIQTEYGSQRKYTIRFDNNYLFRGIITALSKNGFLPLKE